MTNKLGSSNPNKIPQAKTFEYNIKGIQLPLIEKICEEKLKKSTLDIERMFKLEQFINTFEGRLDNVDEKYIITGCFNFYDQ